MWSCGEKKPEDLWSSAEVEEGLRKHGHLCPTWKDTKRVS